MHICFNSRYLEGRTHLFSLLTLALPGIDPNDYMKTLVSHLCVYNIMCVFSINLGYVQSEDGFCTELGLKCLTVTIFMESEQLNAQCVCILLGMYYTSCVCMYKPRVKLHWPTVTAVLRGCINSFCS